MNSPWAASEVRGICAFTETVKPSVGPVQVWDGAARYSYDWDGLQKDPSLWARNGNCLIYLYGADQPGDGPSFRVPFKDLLANKCYPLIERFLVTDGPPPRTPRQLEIWGTDPRRTVKLYIPTPPTIDREKDATYRIAIRNFFAWVLRRSLVGERLGQALVGLLHSMYELRADVKDNVADLMGYMDEEGYLEIANRPTHALAMLFLAETFHLKDLYIRAFAHCVGMKDALVSCLEYHELSNTTRKLIRNKRNELESQVDSTSHMLGNFLEDALSESHLGIPPAARLHLGRFRSFLQSFYSGRLGLYPPRVFDPEVCRAMRDDFAALYRLLVDKTYSASDGMPWVASGGICTLQLVQMFDREHHMEPLDHPLPLIPEFIERSASRRVPWRFQTDKMDPSQRLVAHASLVKASNWQDNSIFDNTLVNAYRTFEDDFVLRANRSKKEKVSVVDSRKVRWLMIHAVYQTLRSITNAPSEVFDAEEAHYHVSISTKSLPPWPETTAGSIGGFLQPTTSHEDQAPSVYWSDTAGAPDVSGRIEIKPDIDYFALTHRDESSTGQSVGGQAVTASPPPRRHKSLSRAIQRSSTLRRSMRVFRPTSAPQSYDVVVPPKATHNEILVEGYGNGLNLVTTRGTTPRQLEKLDTRNNSTASNKDSSGSVSSPESLESGDSIESSIGTPAISPMTYSLPTAESPKLQRRQTVSMLISPSRRGSLASGASAFRRPVSTILSRSSSRVLAEDQSPGEEQWYNFFGGTEAATSHKRHSLQPDLVVEDDWAAMQTFMDGGNQQDANGQNADADMMPAWEQYTDLGGLTETR